MNKNLILTNNTTSQLLISKKLNQWFDNFFYWYSRYDFFEEVDPYTFFDRFPEDRNLPVIQKEYSDPLDYLDDLSVYYDEKLTDVSKEFQPFLDLLQINFNKDHDIQWFFEIIYWILDKLDPMFDYLQDPPFEYYIKLADLIIDVLKQAKKEKRKNILNQIYSDYLDLDNMNMYTYTMGIVIDELLGKRKFNQIYKKRIKLELDNLNLSDYVKEFYLDELKRLNKELKRK